MKEKMKSLLKACFGTAKRTVITIVCVIAAIALLGTVTAYAAVRSTAIGTESAQNYAFADAGVDPAAAENIQTEFGYESGQFVYDIEFTADDTEYEYWIKASDGTVVKKAMEIVTLDGTTATATASITAEEAKAIAFADAGVSESEITVTKAELDYDDGMTVYDVEFYADNVGYEYEINANTGAVYSKSKETKVAAAENATEVTNENTTEATANEGTTGIEAANAEANTENTTTDTDNNTTENGTGTTNEAAGTTGTTDTTGATDTTGSTGTTGTTDTAGGTGGTTTTTEITLDEAKAIALADAGVSASDVTYTKAKKDTDDGVTVYDIEFYTTANEYEYEIKASDGTIIDKSVEAIETNNSGTTGSTGTTGGTTTTTEITLDKAKTIALNDAGVSASDVTYTKAKKDTDDGVTIYDIEFYTATKEYEYEIKASDGTIIDKSVEAIKTNNSGTTGSTGTTGGTTTTTEITLDKAKAIALEDAGVSASDVTYTKAKKDTDDGVTIYDIEFYTATKEYEYEIKASNGKIIDKSVETIKTSDSGSSNTDSGSYISLDEAKEIALNKAGLSASEVTFEKAKLEKDDGIMVYELEFYKGNKEYECTVNASTGAIIDYEVDVDD